MISMLIFENEKQSSINLAWWLMTVTSHFSVVKCFDKCQSPIKLILLYMYLDFICLRLLFLFAQGCAGKRGYIGYKGDKVRKNTSSHTPHCSVLRRWHWFVPVCPNRVLKESEEQMGQEAYQDPQVHRDSQPSTSGGTQRRIGLHSG